MIKGRSRRFAVLAVAALTVALGACTRPPGGGGGGGGGATTTTTEAPGGGGGGGGGGGTQKGPNPTDQTISAERGPFAISQFTVPRGQGYGGGTVYYPTEAGTYGGVAVVPGFSAAQSSIQWYGPRVASQGFVVITIDTNSTGDLPASRGQQLNAALRTITSDSRVAAKVDKNRLAVMGWSMGGGGTMEAARSNPAIKAAVGLAPWNTNTSWASLRTPVLIVQCSSDTIAPNAQHSEAFYRSLGSTEKAIFAVPGSHFCVTTPNTAIAKMSISWLKRFVDDDTRYSTLVCQGPGSGGSNFRSTCPV
jgi:dienelactone hydrolase